MKKKTIGNLVLSYLLIIIIGCVLIFPIVWMFCAAFKTNEEIFGSTALLPRAWTAAGYQAWLAENDGGTFGQYFVHIFHNFAEGWLGTGKNSYATYFMNSFVLVVPTVILTLISSTLVAYGFARFEFPGKKLLFGVLIGTLMLPNAVVIIPRYAMYAKWGWVDTYMPFYVPAALAAAPFFVYMMIQFMRGLPRELDESAYIDGCSTFRTLVQILIPLMIPALFSAGLFQFMWTYNDYFNSLVFINSATKYTVSLGLRLSLDGESVVNWGKIMACATIAVLPLIVLFFAAQKYFVEGIATTGLKG
ncbi:MAG: carbohydrate ABC transporter permease [Aristaeellaceae bacterium]